MRTPVLVILCSLLFVSLPATAHKLNGVEIPDTVSLADGKHNLVLNGAGVREKLFLDIYIGALYLPAKSSDPLAIMSSPGPASVLMHFLYKEVSKEKITDGWTDGLAANHSDEDMQALRPQLEQFNPLFDTMHKGDIIQISYIPGSGTEVRINGELRGSVQGQAFFHALLRVWLGRYPVSASLKEGMLGTH